ncbi:PAS domain S-box protein [Neisseria sp.]|uniref:PAS domain S-box protein n=1 Tax=Neisseria sp. TaxID=192066 RepID=UPI0026DD5D03|nr:PAS domain S-box protein [Neisseria sp.]MDO4906354.1 PAS domain S-box protein [Neisseria sp.]
MNLPYQAMLEQATDSVIYADQTGIIRFWNRASEMLFGFSAEEAVGRSLDIIIPEHLREPHWRGFYAAIETGRTKHGGKPARTKALNKAGGYIYAEVGFCVVVDEETGQKGALSIARAAAPKG